MQNGGGVLHKLWGVVSLALECNSPCIKLGTSGNLQKLLFPSLTSGILRILDTVLVNSGY